MRNQVGTMDKVTAIQNFKFESLHKYMNPIYAELNFHRLDNEETRQALVKKIVPQFFVRLRNFRGWSQEELAKKLNIELWKIEMFERGEAGAFTKALEESYVWVLGGAKELEIFLDELLLFRHPEAREQRRLIARDALRRYGVVFPGFNYAISNQGFGSVLPMVKRSEPKPE